MVLYIIHKTVKKEWCQVGALGYTWSDFNDGRFMIVDLNSLEPICKIALNPYKKQAMDTQAFQLIKKQLMIHVIKSLGEVSINGIYLTPPLQGFQQMLLINQNIYNCWAAWNKSMLGCCKYMLKKRTNFPVNNLFKDLSKQWEPRNPMISLNMRPISTLVNWGDIGCFPYLRKYSCGQWIIL